MPLIVVGWTRWFDTSAGDHPRQLSWRLRLRLTQIGFTWNDATRLALGE